jgi:hypothetical protein
MQRIPAWQSASSSHGIVKKLVSVAFGGSPSPSPAPEYGSAELPLGATLVRSESDEQPDASTPRRTTAPIDDERAGRPPAVPARQTTGLRCIVDSLVRAERRSQRWLGMLTN